MDAIMETKYVQWIKSEGAFAMSTALVGTLYLVEDGIIFSTGNNLLYAMSNNTKSKKMSPSICNMKSELPDGDMAFEFREIAKVEIGSFKQLGLKLTYTIHIDLKDGTRRIFVLFQKEEADKWVSAIGRYL